MTLGIQKSAKNIADFWNSTRTYGTSNQWCINDVWSLAVGQLDCFGWKGTDHIATVALEGEVYRKPRLHFATAALLEGEIYRKPWLFSESKGFSPTGHRCVTIPKPVFEHFGSSVTKVDCGWRMCKHMHMWLHVCVCWCLCACLSLSFNEASVCLLRMHTYINVYTYAFSTISVHILVCTMSRQYPTQCPTRWRYDQQGVYKQQW